MNNKNILINEIYEKIENERNDKESLKKDIMEKDNEL